MSVLPDVDEVWPARFPCESCRSTHPTACAWRALAELEDAAAVLQVVDLRGPAEVRCRCACHYTAAELESELAQCGFLGPDLVTRCGLAPGHSGEHAGVLAVINRQASWRPHVAPCWPCCPACADAERREALRLLAEGCNCR